MSAIIHRAGLVVVLLLAFVLQQTGVSRLGVDPCDDAVPCADEGDRGCAEPGEDECPPSCTDCTGCPGPARGLVAETALVHVVPQVASLPPSWVASPSGHEPHTRLDRPPRSLA